MWDNWADSCAYEWYADWYLPFDHKDDHTGKGILPGRDYIFPDIYKAGLENGFPKPPVYR